MPSGVCFLSRLCLAEFVLDIVSLCLFYFILMEECIREMNKKLVLTEREVSGVVITNKDTVSAVKNGDLCLMAKLFARRFFGMDVVFDAMKKAWFLNGRIECKALGDNVFIFQFSSRADLLKVKGGGPWHVDQNLLVVEGFNGKLSPKEYNFRKVNVWLHVVDPPLMLLTLECAKQFGNLVGRFLEWDKGANTIVWGRKMRIRVEIDLTLPLMRGTNLLMEDGETRWVDFKYERLPYFCYSCGLLGHRYLDCSKRGDDGLDSDSEEFQYPKSLLVEPLKSFVRRSSLNKDGSFSYKSFPVVHGGEKLTEGRENDDGVKSSDVQKGVVRIPEISDSSSPANGFENKDDLNLNLNEDREAADWGVNKGSDEGGLDCGDSVINVSKANKEFPFHQKYVESPKGDKEASNSNVGLVNGPGGGPLPDEKIQVDNVVEKSQEQVKNNAKGGSKWLRINRPHYLGVASNDYGGLGKRKVGTNEVDGSSKKAHYMTSMTQDHCVSGGVLDSVRGKGDDEDMFNEVDDSALVVPSTFDCSAVAVQPRREP